MDAGVVLGRFVETELRAIATVAPGELEAVAVGWATVELERAADELAAALGLDRDEFLPVGEDVALGARCLVAAEALETVAAPARLPLVLLEPSTEGRLAATLARSGEGPAAIWLAPGDLAGATTALRAAGIAIAAARDGPMGPARLMLDGPVYGPHRFLLVRRPGTIEPMTDAPIVTLRHAVPADAEAIASLFTDEGYPAGASDILARLERFDAAGARVVVAEHEGSILGFIALVAIPRFEHDDWILRVIALVVDAGARERGVGRTLMAEAERIGAEIGAAFVEITAGHHRPEARRLYESLGYDPGVAAYLRKKL